MKVDFDGTNLKNRYYPKPQAETGRYCSWPQKLNGL